MLCVYSYMLKFKKKMIGEFQADVEDFKKFWAREHQYVRCACAKLQDGRWYIFYRVGKRGIWAQVKSPRK